MPFGPQTPAAQERSPALWPRLARPVLATVVYVVLHLATHLSARYFEASPGVSLWYPPAGLALSLLVLLGPRYAPAVFAANVAGAWLTADFGVDESILLFPLLITANYTAVAVLVRMLVGPHLLPGSTRTTAVFIGSTLLAPAGIALAGTVAIAQFEACTSEQLLRTAATWWLGDASGLLTIVPAAMVFVGPWLQGVQPAMAEGVRPPRRILLLGAEVLALVASLLVVFSVESLPRSQTFYLCLLPLVWICLRHGLPGATLATLGVTIGALLGLHLTGTSAESATSFLFLELTASVVGLGLGATVTLRDAVERRIAANEARLSRITIGSQVGLWEHDLQSEQVSYSHLCAELLNLDPSRSSAAAAAWYGNIHPEDRPQVMLALQDHLAGKTSIFSVTFRLPPGSAAERWISARGSVIASDQQKRPLLVGGSLIDITERRQAKLISDRQLQIIEATSDFVVTTDSAGHIVYANGAVLRFWEQPAFDTVRGRKIGSLTTRACGEQLEAAAAELACASLWTGELRFGNTAGRELPVSVVALNHRTQGDNAPLYSFVLHDLSRQKQAEADRLERERQLLQLQKAESLGVLAGGIAHDFNNLLTAMIGNAELARLELPPAPALHESLDQIEIAARRAADLCQQMLAYAGRRPLAASDVDLNAVVAQTQRLCQVSISKKIGVHLDLATAPMTVRAAAPQLQQIVLNLVLNAADAIGDNEGSILIRSTLRTFDPAALRAEFAAETLGAGRYVLCEVKDTGHGIPPEIHRRIFEPFFTTKAKGHGLGLAAAHGVVASHGGAITVVSTPGRGSTFRFILPHVADRPAETAPPTPQASAPRSGVVLVVDDEEVVQRVAVRLLESLGFTILTAPDGVEAVALFREHHGRINLVLLDLMMPRMDGVETFGEIHRIDPTVPVVLMSGFVGNLNLDRFPDAKPAGLLAKPFSREDLQNRLREVLVRR
jgi:signal transduction histidine kinase/CheY-like chemotaxis protein/integral membrane sensor domain MASE1